MGYPPADSGLVFSSTPMHNPRKGCRSSPLHPGGLSGQCCFDSLAAFGRVPRSERGVIRQASTTSISTLVRSNIETCRARTRVLDRVFQLLRTREAVVSRARPESTRADGCGAPNETLTVNADLEGQLGWGARCLFRGWETLQSE